jgi:lactoylglutathione lyase
MTIVDPLSLLSALEAGVRIEHIAIWCTDLENLRAFYETYFGARSNEKYINQTTGFESYFLSFESGARLELMRLPSIPQTTNDSHKQFTGLVHLAISVGSEDRVNELTEELRKAGHEVLDGPRRTGDGYYESVVLDPERNRIEITA